MSFASKTLRHLRRVLRDNSAVAAVEMAVSAPIVLLTGLVGMELSNLALVNLRVSQAAMHIADNASRIGHGDLLVAQQIYEDDINDLFVGVNLQAGEGLGLYEHGRVIVSSLEQNEDDGQWIHWQRCMGRKAFVSAYGSEGTGETGTGLPGMGPAGAELKAAPGQAVMYVEIAYTYQPLVNVALSDRFLTSREIRSESAFVVRGSRNLDGIFQRAAAAPVASCDKYGVTP